MNGSANANGRRPRLTAVVDSSQTELHQKYIQYPVGCLSVCLTRA